MTIGILGGTGKEGRGLALRWAAAGFNVIIGSRDAERGAAKAVELDDGRGLISGGGNADAAQQAEVVVLAVPYGAHKATLEAAAPHLTGKLLIDITVPLKPPKVRRVHLPDGQSAALEAAAIVGEGVFVAAALHHVSSAHLADPEHTIDCDVLVCCDNIDMRQIAIQFVGGLGLRAVDAGPLVNSIALESLTPVLLHINRKYKSPGAGIRITGIGT
jgi:8-hydroxy-5-deazaflavin:NADPH oxidoreductase